MLCGYGSTKERDNEEDEEGTDLIQMQVIIDYLLADDKHPVIALMFQKKLTSNTPS